MKRLLIIFLLSAFIFAPSSVLAQDCECINSSSHIVSNGKMQECGQVGESENYYILYKGNIIKIAFECKFMSECANEGDEIHFYLPKDIYDECGNIVLAMGTTFCGYIRGITDQKKFNKNARVYVNITKMVLNDGTELEIKAKPYSKDFSLVENGWMTTGKIAAYTVGLGAVGTGAGIGLAFIPKPHKIAVGAGAGVAIGCFIGLVTGLVTPGLKYHARQGEEIKMILCDDIWIPKCAIKEF